MDNQTALKSTIKIFQACLTLLIFYIPISCINCDILEERYRNDECLLIVKEKPDFGDTDFNYRGFHPYTRKPCDCRTKTSFRWWTLYKENINIGDTIIKRKGELIFNIHKKDTVLSFHWKCEGETYD